MTIIILIFVLIVALWAVGRSDWHLNRNKHNKLPKGGLQYLSGDLYKDDSELIWKRQPHIKNKFHQPDGEVAMVDNPYPNISGTLTFDPKNPNLKFLCETASGGSYEVIVQPDGKYLIEGLKQGTYNYGHPSGFFGSMKHVFLDVVPHFINSKYK